MQPFRFTMLITGRQYKVDVEGIAEQRVPLVGKTSFEVK